VLINKGQLWYKKGQLCQTVDVIVVGTLTRLTVHVISVVTIETTIDVNVITVVTIIPMAVDVMTVSTKDYSAPFSKLYYI
jgi:hypothetical protein